jgi:hypothetical protein
VSKNAKITELENAMVQSSKRLLNETNPVVCKRLNKELDEWLDFWVTLSTGEDKSSSDEETPSDKAAPRRSGGDKAPWLK